MSSNPCSYDFSCVLHRYSEWNCGAQLAFVIEVNVVDLVNAAGATE